MRSITNADATRLYKNDYNMPLFGTPENINIVLENL